jgi:hypothetical protein
MGRAMTSEFPRMTRLRLDSHEIVAPMQRIPRKQHAWQSGCLAWFLAGCVEIGDSSYVNDHFTRAASRRCEKSASF